MQRGGSLCFIGWSLPSSGEPRARAGTVAPRQQCSSDRPRPPLCDPKDRSTPGLPDHPQLPERPHDVEVVQATARGAANAAARRRVPPKRVPARLRVQDVQPGLCIFSRYSRNMRVLSRQICFWEVCVRAVVNHTA